MSTSIRISELPVYSLVHRGAMSDDASQPCLVLDYNRGPTLSTSGKAVAVGTLPRILAYVRDRWSESVAQDILDLAVDLQRM